MTRDFDMEKVIDKMRELRITNMIPKEGRS